MSLSDVLQMARRRWLTALLTFLVVVGAAVFALHQQKPVYEASATIGLVPQASANGDTSLMLAFLGQAPAILPLYSEAATSADTRALAQQKLAPGESLGSLSVSTFQNFPTVLRINAKSNLPIQAQHSAQAYVDALQSRAASGDIGVSDVITLQELGSPTLPTDPVSPHKKLTIGIAVLLGLVLAGAAVALRETVGGTVDTGDALAHASGLPVFGEVPDTNRVDRVRSCTDWLENGRLALVNEAMRDLSVTLQLTQFDSDSVLVTSPEGRHGKTTVSFGIAVALARSGVKTLLVDADLRRGRLEEMFADEPGHSIRKSPGLVDVLRGMPLESAVQATSLRNLSVLTSGDLVDDPSELLDVAFPNVLREMERHSAVVLDGTPLVPINDARVVARFVGSTVVVTAAGTLGRGAVKKAVDRLRIIGVKPTAAILNRTRQRQPASYALYLSDRTRAPGGMDTPTRRDGSDRGMSAPGERDDLGSSSVRVQPPPPPPPPIGTSTSPYGSSSSSSAPVSFVDPQRPLGTHEPSPQHWADEERRDLH